jgi:hypothetical protein
MASYAQDRAWSDRFIPEIKRIVGPYLLCESSFEVDTLQAADLVVMKAKNMTIACRIRRPGYAESYPNDFTIRSHRASGAETEFDKLVKGWGDWMFYGHAQDNDSNHIRRWMLIDLSSWRAHMIRRDRYKFRYGDGDNRDGTHFYWFDSSSFPTEPALLIACSWGTP